MNKEQPPFRVPNHHQHQKAHELNLKTPNSRQIELVIELDENNLRRTNSEPNLKVKSALKDRLLEKRNLQNPFQRPSKHSNNNTQAAKMSPPPSQHPQLQAFQKQQPQMLIPSQLQKGYLLPGAKHAPTHNDMRHNDQIMAALAQAAALASAQQNEQHLQQQLQYSNPDFLSLHKQQLAASALLSLSNSQANIAEEQRAYNFAATLRNLQQQQQNSLSMNVSDRIRRKAFFLENLRILMFEFTSI